MFKHTFQPLGGDRVRNDVAFESHQPWKGLGYPRELVPLLEPRKLLAIAEQTLRPGGPGSGTEEARKILDRIRSDPAWLLEDTHRRIWGELVAEIDQMRRPVLPRELCWVLGELEVAQVETAWEAYHQSLYRDFWEQVPENPLQDWRVVGLFPRSRLPRPIEIEVPLKPGPGLWMTWVRRPEGVAMPLLVRAATMPIPNDTLELKHGEIVWRCGLTLTGVSVALDRPEASGFLDALFYLQGGLWEEVEPVSEPT